MSRLLLIYNVLKTKVLNRNLRPTIVNQDFLLIFMRIPQKFDSLATLTHPAVRAFSLALALALFCLSAAQPASAQNFSVTGDVDISKFVGNQTDPAVAVNPNAATNIFVAAVSSATNGLFTAYTTNLAMWTSGIIAWGTNNSTNLTTNLVQAYGEPSVAWDLNSNLFLAYEPANNQGIAVAFSTNGGQTFFALTNLVPNDVTDQPRIAAGVAGTNVGPNIGSVWLVYKDYSLFGTPLVAQGLQTINVATNVSSPVPGLGSNVTDLIGTNSIAYAVLSNNVATITNNQLVIGTNTSAAITLTTNTFIVTANNTNLSSFTFNTNAGFVTTITPTTNRVNGTNYITNYAIHTFGIGPFSSPEVIPGSSNGGFPDIAIGPSNQVMVAYQNNIFSSSASKVFVNVNTNALLTNGFGAAVTVAANAVGGFTYIPAEEAANGINAGVGLAWDENPASLFYGRAYIVYTAGASPGLNIYSSFSVNNGKSWTSAMQVNDDTNGNDHFLPRITVDQSTASIGFCWYDCRNDTGPSSTQIIGPIVNNSAMTTNTYTNIFDLDGTPNDDFMVYGTISTNGGTNVLANLPMIPIWTLSTLTAANPGPAGGESFTYSSEAALADNANGVGHHIGLAYASGNFYPVWADNSDFLGDSPSPATDFQLYMPTNAALQTARLVISVTEAPYPPTSDEALDYYVVLTNLGPSTASNVFITNILAANVTLDQVIASPGGSYSVSGNGQTLIFNLGSLAATKALTNRIIITANQSGFATNIASVSTTTIAPSLGSTPVTNIVQEANGNGFQTYVNGNIVTNIVVVNGEDLSLTMLASPTNVDIGNPVTYTLTVSNLGPAANGLVYITNTLPSNLGQISNVVQTNVTYSISGTNAVQTSVTYSISNNIVVFSLGTIPTNQTDAITYTATTLSLGSRYQYATNLAFVTSTDFDTNLLNNTASTVVTILGEDLGLGLSASAANVDIGATITYTLTVTNFGPSTSGIISITNLLSDNLGQISVVQYPPAGWSGSISRGLIVFDMGQLAVNQSITIIFTAVALSISATDTNAVVTANVSSTDFDTNLANNTALVTTTINGEDLAVGLSASSTTAWEGLPIDYTVTVTNLGLSTTGIISVTNTFSANLSQIAVLQAPGTYTISGNTVVFHPGALNVGQTATMLFEVTPTSVGTATDSVVVASTDFDPNLLNNSAQVTTTVIVPPPISVTAYASAAIIVWNTPANATVQVAYGTNASYGSITSLSGPSTHHVVLLTGLARDTTYFFNALSYEQGAFYSTNGSFATVDTLILNTIDASYTGSWAQGSSSLAGIYGIYFNVANTTTGNPTASATYTPLIPTPGLYNVSAWYPQSSNFSPNTQMYVSGTTNVIIDSVDQTTNGGSWQPLATNLYLASGTGGNVVIYNDTGVTNNLVAANAMMWSYAASQDYPSNGVPPAWWTTFYFGTNATGAASNYAAYVFGASPGDPADTPDFWLTFPASNTVMVCFAPFMGGRTYQLQTTTNLSNPEWVTLSLTNQPTMETNADGVFTNGTGYGAFTITQPNAAQSFFRLSAQLVPQ